MMTSYNTLSLLHDTWSLAKIQNTNIMLYQAYDRIAMYRIRCYCVHCQNPFRESNIKTIFDIGSETSPKRQK